MAEPTENNPKDENAQAVVFEEHPPAKSAADLHLPQIIAALHENAIAKCTGDLGSDYRITNSALDGEGDKAKLTSAGQHIISVIPVKADIKVKKSNAVKALKTYVAWFVGPDLANKVTNDTVKSLNEAPGSAGKKEEKEKNESRLPFMKFSQFLHEADDDISSAANDDEKPDFNNGEGEDDGDAAPDDPKNSDFGEEQEDEEKKQEDEKKEKEDESVESKLGYYVPYDLKVEGMKQTALKDSMKKFAMNFFDDLKITAAGLFGGGDSFTVKDVKDAFRSAFGPIDPDELVRNVEERIGKKYRGSDSSYDVKIQDKATLISDLGSTIKGPQKKQIDSAEYSLYIKIRRDDPKKDIFNPTIIADIVQSSITGLYKKFKNKITKNDVIYIPNYNDEHENTDKLRALYDMVPSPDTIRSLITKARNANMAYEQIDKKFERIRADKNYKNLKRARLCLQQWDNQRIAWEKNGDDPNKRGNLTDNAKNEYFAKFEEAYAKIFKDTENKSLNESNYTLSRFVITSKDISNLILESIFNTNSLLSEDDEQKNDNKANSVDINKIKNDVVHFLNDKKVFDDKKIKNENIVCLLARDLKSKYPYFNIDQSTIEAICGKDFSAAKNALCFCQTTAPEGSGKNINESGLRNAIMSILFEDSSGNSKIVDIIRDVMMSSIVKNSNKTITKDDISFEVFSPTSADDFVKDDDSDSDSKDDEQNDGNEDNSDEDIENILNESAGQKEIIDAVKHIIKSNGWTIADMKKELNDELAKWNVIKGKPGEKLSNYFPDNKVFKTIKNTIAKTTGDKENASRLSRKNILEVLEKLKNTNIDDTSSDDGKNDKDSDSDNATDSKNKKPIPGINDLYVAFFGKEQLVSTPDAEKVDAENSGDESSSIDDLYIIPMPGLKYQDPEYANTKL